MRNTQLPLPFLQTEGNYFFKLVSDGLPVNRTEVQLLNEKGNGLGPSFVFQLVDPDPDPKVRGDGRKTLDIRDAVMDAIKVQFCQYVMVHLFASESPYYDLVKSFHVRFGGAKLSGIGSVGWKSGPVPLNAVALNIRPTLELHP